MSQRQLISAITTPTADNEAEHVDEVDDSCKVQVAMENLKIEEWVLSESAMNETVLPWPCQNPRSFRILNAKKLEEASAEESVLENLRILGFKNVTVDCIETPQTDSMSTKSGSISLSFSASSALADQLWKFIGDPDFEKKSFEANRAEFGEDVGSYLLLTGNLLYHDFKEYAYVKDCLGEILKLKPDTQNVTLSHVSFRIGAGEPKGIKEICSEYPEIAKKCWENLKAKGKINVEFIAKRNGIPKTFWM